MQGNRLLLVCGLALACACSRSPQASSNGSSASAAAAPQAGPADAGDASQAAGAERTQPLGEFETQTRADVELYLKVMRAAADRVKNMPAADREVLRLFRQMTSGGGGQMPTPEQMAALQRAGDLMALDAVVARELRVSRRFSSISGRVPMYGMPDMGGSSGDDEPMSAEERAALKVRIAKFRQRRQADAAMCEPFRAEIESLQRQVNFTLHPEAIPK